MSLPTQRMMVKHILSECVVPRTAAQLQERILRQMGKRVGLASLSSLLCRMVARGELHRHDGVGPRGGYGYTLAREKSPSASRRRKPAKKMTRVEAEARLRSIERHFGCMLAARPCGHKNCAMGSSSKHD